MNPEMQERIRVVFECVKTVFHWGFIPGVLYLGNYFENPLSMCNLLNYLVSGFSKGAEPGMPPLSITR